MPSLCRHNLLTYCTVFTFSDNVNQPTWSLANSAAAESWPCPSLALTALTSVLAVLHLCRAEEVRGDMKVRLARAAVTRRKVSSPPFRRERPEKIVISFLYIFQDIYCMYNIGSSPEKIWRRTNMMVVSNFM